MPQSIQMTNQEANRRDVISVIRMVATIAVFLIHFNSVCPLPEPLRTAATYGQDGLWVYYFLSGYLAMVSYEHTGSTKEYWQKRIIRIFPLYYGWLLILFIFRSFFFSWGGVQTGLRGFAPLCF